MHRHPGTPALLLLLQPLTPSPPAGTPTHRGSAGGGFSLLEGDHIKINPFLLPLSWLYGWGVEVRNILFDTGTLRSERFDLPVISVGNLTVGGTGKTPHTEYLVRLLGQKYQVAVLSRGYKRRSHGFLMATADTPMHLIGDEPWQMRQKFADIHVAVDNDRCHGIRQLLRPIVAPRTEVILLDDAFQHRRVRPGLSLVLMDYHRLSCFDRLLPAGRLREPLSSLHRADVVIVTKCPKDITPMERHGISRSLGLQAWQKLFFTHFVYDDLQPLGAGQPLPVTQLRHEERSIVLLTGIAAPQQMEYDLQQLCRFTPLHFPDHHYFTRSDLRRIAQTLRSADPTPRHAIIITTEKDAARLHSLRQGSPDERHLIEDIQDDIYVLPAHVEFLGQGDTDKFNKLITDYVAKNPRDRRFSQSAHGLAT